MGEKGLTLSPIICDGMILQRDTYNGIYGTETNAEAVTVYFMNKEYRSAVGEYHEFYVELPPVAAGGPYSLTIKGSDEITINDILFGDVYLLSGQSNMELPIRRVLDVSGDEIKHTTEPTIRQYLIPATYNFSEPEKFMCASTWNKAVGEDLMGFSAVGYFFAKEIKETYKVPIGLIMTGVGGSTIEAWMNPETLGRFGDFKRVVEPFKNKTYFNNYIQEQQSKSNEWLCRLEEEEQSVTDSEDYKEWQTCKVPSLVSDYGTTTFQGSVYMCKEVILEDEVKDEDAYIYMGSIIDSDRVWINTELVGRTEYRYPPRKYPIKKGVLKKGTNLITVRIVINNKNGGTVHGKPYHLYCNHQKTSLAGQWYYKVGKEAEAAMPEALFPPKLPICFYNTAIVPLSKIAIKGVLWYQGESNTETPEDYAEKFAAMVSDWRELMGWEVPFLYVQLSNFRAPLNTTEDTGWAQLRDQQRQNLSLYNVAMVVTMDIGEANDLHPQNKKEVGRRLAKAAGYLIYNQTDAYSSPIPIQSKVVGRVTEICFKHIEDTGAEVNLNNFELAGCDGVFHSAKAVRNANKVFVYSEKVDVPAHVRYAWCDNPTNINFYNEEGLPASGFRLDL